MPPLAIAAGVAGIAGAAGSVISSNNNKNAIAKSTDANLQAQREAIASQEKLFQQNLAQQQAALDKSLGFQTNALNQAMGFQTDAYNSSGKLQTDVRNQNIAILNPLAQTGYGAMNSINALLGLEQQQAYTPQNISFTPVKANPIAAPVVAPTPAPTGQNALLPATTSPTAAVAYQIATQGRR